MRRASNSANASASSAGVSTVYAFSLSAVCASFFARRSARDSFGRLAKSTAPFVITASNCNQFKYGFDGVDNLPLDCGRHGLQGGLQFAVVHFGQYMRGDVELSRVDITE